MNVMFPFTSVRLVLIEVQFCRSMEASSTYVWLALPDRVTAMLPSGWAAMETVLAAGSFTGIGLGTLPEKLKLTGKSAPAPTMETEIWWMLPSALVPPSTKLLRSKETSTGCELAPLIEGMLTPYMYWLPFSRTRFE